MVWKILLWSAYGGLIGWLSSLIMRNPGRRAMLTDIAIGAVGALLGGLIYVRGALERPIKPKAFIVALLLAIILLSIVNLFRRGRMR